MDASAPNDFADRLATVAAEIEALRGAALAPFGAKADILRAAARFIAVRKT
jgi:hypothetical protein